ncbi:DUF2975 domain-containing protein [Anaerocolumna xylanovorans]|uniref:DUF2975 domain-containing protein n=1 Tax=Anaerocolumna xylanovorans DSM 12503 TaxID=1121345 RepID=A0A1M7Y6W2_9FIRM|nr:DUF2975 domain-containing protein [Anaerocolumna xylanovorans]SHO48372.1 Protein of unknown function [Anaerocolumna xylanovorans DSM 12503]
MKQKTFFLKMSLFLIGIPVLALCILVLPWIGNEAAEHYPKLVYLPVLIGIYLTAIPFYFALYQAFKLLSYIDKNNAFSELSVNSLKYIKYCAALISIIYAVSLPLFYLMAQKDDAPGIVVIGLVCTFAPLVIAVFAAVLQKLLENAIDIKTENDLTV